MGRYAMTLDSTLQRNTTMPQIHSRLAPGRLALTLLGLGFLGLGFLGLAAPPSFASPVTYAIRATDNSGALVPGATVAVGTTALTPGAPTSVPVGAGERVLGTGAAPAAAVTVTLLDYGTGDYGLVYDPAATGEMYFPLTVSKAGSTITNGNALIPVVCAADSSTLVANGVQAAANGVQEAANGVTLNVAVAQTTPTNQQANVQAGLILQGLTTALVQQQLAAMLRIYAAEWGPLTRSGTSYVVAMPALALTVPAAGSQVGTVTPTYDALGHPVNTAKTVN